MSTIRFNETKTLRPEQYITGLPKEQGLVRTPVRRRGLGRWIRGAAPVRRLQADLEIRPQDAREGSERASRLRYGYRGGVPRARTAEDRQLTSASVVPTALFQPTKELP
jgi:hypothetical protein